MPTSLVLSDVLPFLDELPDDVVERAAALAGLESAADLRSQVATDTSATTLACAIAKACLEDPQRSLEETSVGVVIPCRDDDDEPQGAEAMSRLVTVYGLPETGGLSSEKLLSWLLELAIRSKAGEPSVERGGRLCVGADERVRGVNLTTASALLVALQEIAAWAYLEHGEGGLPSALRLETREPIPGKVKEAFATLHAIVSVGYPPPPRYGAYDLDVGFRDLEQSVGRRPWEVFVQRQLAVDRRPTLEALGQQFGLTRERVRQLESQAERTIREATIDPEKSVIRRAAIRLHDHLGEVARAPDLQRALKFVDPYGHALEAKPERTRLLLRLAGPYVPDAEWIVRDDIARRAARELQAAVSQRPIELGQALAMLVALGVHPEVCADWLRDLPGLRIVGGSLVRWQGSIVDKAETILRVAGEPMTAADIFEAIAEDRSIRSLVNGIQADNRFMRRGLEHYGLREWGGEEYTTIVDEIQQEIERQGGEATLDHLIATLTRAFGVSENSVRTYSAQHPLFTQTERGTICLREAGQYTPGSRRALEETRGCFRLEHGWALRLRVTTDTLRGSGTPMPASLAEHVGVTPRRSRDFQSDVGDLHVGWPSLQPQIGSQRRAAELLGLGEGDLLFVEFMNGHVRFHGATKEQLDQTEGIVRLARETGGNAGNESDALAWVRRALAVDDADQDAYATIRRRLIARKELELAALVPEADLTEPDDELLSILASLGE